LAFSRRISLPNEAFSQQMTANSASFPPFFVHLYEKLRQNRNLFFDFDVKNAQNRILSKLTNIKRTRRVSAASP
jgi:hypothetical protein